MITDEEIFEIIDGIASENLLAKHTSLFEISQEYRNRFEEILKIETILSTLKIESPSLDFTSKVMGKFAVAQSLVCAKNLIKIPFYFLGFLIFIVAIISIFVLKSTQNVDSNYDIGIGFNFANNLILKQTLLIVNGIIFLLILDKLIIKKYFQSRFG